MYQFSKVPSPGPLQLDPSFSVVNFHVHLWLAGRRSHRPPGRPFPRPAMPSGTREKKAQQVMMVPGWISVSWYTKYWGHRTALGYAMSTTLSLSKNQRTLHVSKHLETNQYLLTIRHKWLFSGVSKRNHLHLRTKPVFKSIHQASNTWPVAWRVPKRSAGHLGAETGRVRSEAGPRPGAGRSSCK